MDRERENELVRSCRQGDRVAMEALVSEYEKPVYNVAYRMLGNTDDAADVMQSTFLKAFSNLGQFDPTYRFFSWIYRIAMNESINLLKKQPHNEALSDALAAETPEPGDIIDSGRVNREVQAALLKLAEEYRSVVALRYFAGFSYRQMAETLQIPEKTVKSRLFSARRKMKDALEGNRILSP